MFGCLQPDSPQEDGQAECKVCKETVLQKNMKDHKKSFKHMEAQKQKYGEVSCDICSERFVQGYWKEHKKSKTHILMMRQQKEKITIGKPRSEVKSGHEMYQLREASGENQEYINTLSTFLAVRFALNSRKGFKISVNNEEWMDFGDIVVEVVDSEKSEIEAIRCKKIQTKNSYSTVAFSAESGNLSLKEQCEILKKLRTKENYKNANFKLLTVSSVSLDPRFTYGSGEIEIKRCRSNKKDLFNTTDDSDDICTFQLSNHENTDLDTDLSKFSLYFNQKKITELVQAIGAMVKNRFNIESDISEELIKYMGKKFKTGKKFKKKERNFKMTREDVLLKIEELLLTPFFALPDRVYREEELHLWNTIVQEFDIIVTNTDEAICTKIYSGLNQVLNRKIDYRSGAANRISVDTSKISDERLRLNLFDRDSSLHSLYLALWKTFQIPLVVKAEDWKQLAFITSVIIFFKKENLPLTFIITTPLKLDRGYFPGHLKVFFSLADVRFLNDNLLEKVLSQKIKMLDFEISLQEIDSLNNDFLEKVTPEAFLNILLKDCSFIDGSVALTKDITDNTIVVDDDVMMKIKTYFNKKGGVEQVEVKQGQENKELSYLVSIKGYPISIHVPPRL